MPRGLLVIICVAMSFDITSFTPVRFSIPAATRRWSARSRLPAAPAAGPRCPPAPSTGENEAVELRDGDKKRWLGKGVSKAVANVNATIGPNLIGMDAREQETIDDS